MLKVCTTMTLAGVATAGLPAGYPSIPMKGVNGNVPMPLVGLGTWQYNDTVAEHATLEAFKLGFRHVDTAYGYNNQVGVGKALKQLEAGGLKRQEYFVTSKIPGGLNATAAQSTLDEGLVQLGLDYVDLLLLHFPATWGGKGGAALRKEEWLALEKWAKTGKAKAIGISHYCKKHVDDILSVATVPIALNQVMYHVGMGQSPDVATDFKDYDVSKGIVYMSFCTLCGPCGEKEHMELITGPLVTEIGKAHNVSGAQVSLRWAVQKGIPVVPKSTNPNHLAQDFDIFSFTLTDEEMAKLDAATTPATGAKDSGDCEVAEAVVV
jgi:diketogulonate reductase-like aldo/keto reductase